MAPGPNFRIARKTDTDWSEPYQGCSCNDVRLICFTRSETFSATTAANLLLRQAGNTSESVGHPRSDRGQ